METSREPETQEAPAHTGAPQASATLPMMRIPPRVFEALVLLFESQAYANDLGKSPWDFAIELRSLRRLGLTNSDFRWLVGKQLVDHAREMTLVGERQRSFRRSELLTFSAKTCFVLTAQGMALAATIIESKGDGSLPAAAGQELSMPGQVMTVMAGNEYAVARGSGAARSASSNGKLTPKWDRDRQELRVGDRIVKQFKVPAANQETILAAFEEEHWPARIDDPLPPHADQDSKRRLHDTINSLNRNQKRSLVRFIGDGSGTGIRWEFVDEHS